MAPRRAVHATHLARIFNRNLESLASVHFVQGADLYILLVDKNRCWAEYSLPKKSLTQRRVFREERQSSCVHLQGGAACTDRDCEQRTRDVLEKFGLVTIHTVRGRVAARSPNKTATAVGGDEHFLDLRFGNSAGAHLAHSAPILSIAFGPCNTILYSGSGTFLYAWRVGVNGGSLCFAPIDTGSPVKKVAASHDGSLVAAGGADGRVRIYAVDTARNKASLRITLESDAETTNPVTALAFAPNRHVLAVGRERGDALLWDVDSHSAHAANDHADCVTSVDFSPAGNIFAAACKDGNVDIYRIGDREWTGEDAITLSDNDYEAIMGPTHLAPVFHEGRRRVIEGEYDAIAQGFANKLETAIDIVRVKISCCQAQERDAYGSVASTPEKERDAETSQVAALRQSIQSEAIIDANAPDPQPGQLNDVQRRFETLAAVPMLQTLGDDRRKAAEALARVKDAAGRSHPEATQAAQDALAADVDVGIGMAGESRSDQGASLKREFEMQLALFASRYEWLDDETVEHTSELDAAAERAMVEALASAAHTLRQFETVVNDAVSGYNTSRQKSSDERRKVAAAMNALRQRHSASARQAAGDVARLSVSESALRAELEKDIAHNDDVFEVAADVYESARQRAMEITPEGLLAGKQSIDAVVDDMQSASTLVAEAAGTRSSLNARAKALPSSLRHSNVWKDRLRVLEERHTAAVAMLEDVEKLGECAHGAVLKALEGGVVGLRTERQHLREWLARDFDKCVRYAALRMVKLRLSLPYVEGARKRAEGDYRRNYALQVPELTAAALQRVESTRRLHDCTTGRIRVMEEFLHQKAQVGESALVEVWREKIHPTLASSPVPNGAPVAPAPLNAACPFANYVESLVQQNEAIWRDITERAGAAGVTAVTASI